MLSVQNLSCRRGGRIIFQKLAFECEPGGFVLVTGANGSGKSSLLRLLAGLLSSFEGTISWRGNCLEDRSSQEQGSLHYIGHQEALKLALTAQEMVHYWQALRGVSPDRSALSFDGFGVSAFAHEKIARLSAGQKRRLSLTRLLLDDAPLWILDEPTTALDAAGEKLLLTAIARHRALGGCVVAAMHHEPALAISHRLTLRRAS